MEKSIIKNKKALTVNSLRRDALDILEVGYEAILIKKAMVENVSFENAGAKAILKIKDKKYNLKKYKKIFVIAIGKCANQSAQALEEILGDKITGGVVLDIELAQFKKLKSKVGTHPLPSSENIAATEAIMEILEKAGKNDLVLAIISGGGSALLCSPVTGMDAESLTQITKALTTKGAPIGEINIVRKHLSQIKGGQFAKLSFPAKSVSLIFSDVPGNELNVIASGPTVFDETTKEDARIVLESYFGLEQASQETELISFLIETPKERRYFEDADNFLLLTNKVALEAMRKKAEELGYDAFIESDDLQGEAKLLGAKLTTQDYLSKTCRLWGGETTVRIKGDGKGGRNQEFVLGAVPNLSKDMLVLAAASDGWDNTNVAGALADKDIFAEIEKENLDITAYLENNDSYNFFKKVGTQIKTNRLGANVADFYLILTK